MIWSIFDLVNNNIRGKQDGLHSLATHRMKYSVSLVGVYHENTFQIIVQLKTFILSTVELSSYLYRRIIFYENQGSTTRFVIEANISLPKACLEDRLVFNDSISIDVSKRYPTICKECKEG